MAKKKGAPDEEAQEEEEQSGADGEDTGDDGDKKGKKGKKDKSKDEPPEEPSARAGYIGLGLVGSLVVGFDPLRDAFQGNGSFENAMLRFLACVAVCVVGAGTIGRMIDASGPEPDEANPDGIEPDADGNPIPGQDGEPGAGEDTGETSNGSASSTDSGRQDTEQQLTSSEEMS